VNVWGGTATRYPDWTPATQDLQAVKVPIHGAGQRDLRSQYAGHPFPCNRTPYPIAVSQVPPSGFQGSVSSTMASGLGVSRGCRAVLPGRLALPAPLAYEAHPRKGFDV
jgi:hypothetical protein